MTTEERNQLIATYSAGYDEVVDALQNFPEEHMTSHPIQGKWSACEIVHHLADSESTSAHQVREIACRRAASDSRLRSGQFATHLKYNERDMAPALDAFRAARATTAQLSALMSEEDWHREGEHTESGRYTAEDWLKIYAEHAHNHAAQIRRLRSALS